MVWPSTLLKGVSMTCLQGYPQFWVLANKVPTQLNDVGNKLQALNL